MSLDIAKMKGRLIADPVSPLPRRATPHHLPLMLDPSSLVSSPGASSSSYSGPSTASTPSPSSVPAGECVVEIGEHILSASRGTGYSSLHIGEGPGEDGVFHQQPLEEKVKNIVWLLVRGEFVEWMVGYVLVGLMLGGWAFAPWETTTVFWSSTVIGLLEGTYKWSTWADCFDSKKCVDVARAQNYSMFTAFRRNVHLRIGFLTVNTALYSFFWVQMMRARMQDSGECGHSTSKRWCTNMYSLLMVDGIMLVVHWFLRVCIIILSTQLWIASGVQLGLPLPGIDNQCSKISKPDLAPLEWYVHHRKHFWQSITTVDFGDECGLQSPADYLENVVHSKFRVSEAQLVDCLSKVHHAATKGNHVDDGFRMLEYLLQLVQEAKYPEVYSNSATHTILTLLKNKMVLASVEKFKRTLFTEASTRREMAKFRKRMLAAVRNLDDLCEGLLKRGEIDKVASLARSVENVLAEVGEMEVWKAKFLHQHAMVLESKGGLNNLQRAETDVKLCIGIYGDKGARGQGDTGVDVFALRDKARLTCAAILKKLGKDKEAEECLNFLELDAVRFSDGANGLPLQHDTPAAATL